MEFETQAKINLLDIGGVLYESQISISDSYTTYSYINKSWSLHIGIEHLVRILRRFYENKNRLYYNCVIGEFDYADNRHSRNYYEVYQKSYKMIGRFYKNEI